MQSQNRSDDGYTAANPALRTALDNAPLTPKDPSTGATFDLASMLPPPRRGNAGASRPYVYYDGAQATPSKSRWDCRAAALITFASALAVCYKNIMTIRPRHNLLTRFGCISSSA